MLEAVSHVYSWRLRAGHSDVAVRGAAWTRTTVFPMSRDMLVPLVLAAVFTLGCVSIHGARKYPDAMTLALLLLLGFLATVYVGQHVQLDARHPTWQHEASDLKIPLPAHPVM
ncbi:MULTISPECIES: hypothetical protein [Methylobacterium]|jgi:hypothetical protein|uniref:Uncharacterized protein n=1 Tax=Methylobacterium longum TaxID=767694 RepID=A0ABT8AHU4_9HYPH|nr:MULTISPECIES: hypothetical protein [Methylobacterium]MCJ2100103.1 hypothetical protein [Methylobacterium sp. E-046]MDN3569379.1 hypothetical protein [Methylobacterium longum]GJE12325.1 hypothetical protein FOHLNKBM_3374 [Methylobacterium longum]